MACRLSVVVVCALILGACASQDTTLRTDPAPREATARTLSTREAPRLVVAGFNVESGGADPRTLADRVAALSDVNLWGLSEVQNAGWSRTLSEAAAKSGRTFRSITGTTGGADRLAVLLDTSVLAYVGHWELGNEMIAACGQVNARAPLVVEVEAKANGRRLLFMVNHLQRGNAAYRECQAGFLNAWARSIDQPLIAVGDYNFDWNLPHGETNHGVGYDRLTDGDVFRWVRPATLVKTNCDERYNSVLDFVFVAGPARQWPAESTIEFTSPNYCHPSIQGRESDHRPVLARFVIPPR